jgi:hypothetical protein
MNDRQRVMLGSAKGAESLAAELCKNLGWEMLDVTSGLLWGIVKMCRKVGLTREQTLKLVTAAFDGQEFDEIIDRAKSGVVS